MPRQKEQKPVLDSSNRWVRAEGVLMVDYLLCADWSKQYKGRALYAADVRARKLFRVVGPGLTVYSALEKARELAAGKNVLFAFDLPLGLPQSFLSAIRAARRWEGASSFIEFLPIAARSPSFFVSGQPVPGRTTATP